MANCAKCGEKVGGFTGLTTPFSGDVEKCEQMGIEVPKPICAGCFSTFSKQAEKELAVRQETERAQIEKLPISTTDFLANSQYASIGIVSSHIAIGTGAVSEILSAWTDFFGQQSETYNKKMQEAEQACLIKLKQAAISRGADAVLGVQTTYTELTSGHGMLLVCMTGTAVKLVKGGEGE